MTCGNCIHECVCAPLCSGIDMALMMKDENVELLCSQFKDKSRFVEMPCKVGDTTYFVTDRWKNHGEYEIVETTVIKVGLKGSGAFFQMRVNKSYETAVSAFGKSVFLTREEAEKALKEKQR